MTEQNNDVRQQAAELPEDLFITKEGLEHPHSNEARLSEELTPFEATKQFLEDMRARRAIDEDDSDQEADLLRTGAFGKVHREPSQLYTSGQHTSFGDNR